MEIAANTEIERALESGEDGMQDRFLVFTIDGQDYAIEIRYVIEIIEVLPITAVPSLPACMKGIINLRGAVIPIMDVRLRFGLVEQEYTERTCIIVIDNNGIMLGLIVDAVQEVSTIGEEERMPPPSTSDTAGVRYIKGVSSIGGAIQLLLDCDKLIEIMG